ncbi:metallophosphoesterase family protein [Desulfobulbus alkaliphilus]|uniref:metallophosphoesterase family protein n=1 Tax=Desulfobulbus alkaliphilus TaxID=869814 RepID=UPI0019669BE0|nr:metallophosphoesterase [Desulfobulbus alkaliphilus]MBM9538442.1 metallophosphoesterase [Desulfobulbus alkaliphilus]
MPGIIISRHPLYAPIVSLTLATLLLILVPVNSLYGTPSLKIGILGDQTGSNDLVESYRILTKGVATLRQEEVDLVLHLGDLVESTRSKAEIRNDFQTAVDILSSLGRPWYLTPGDHDVNPPERLPDSPDRSREKLFQELLAAHIPEVRQRLYYSFSHNGYHFIALNALEHLHTDPRWGNVFLARISEKQLDWLRRDLERNKQAEAIIVFLHQPLWYNWAGWQPVHQVLREYGVVAVLAGHFHYDQDDGELDGIRYLIFGATGGAIKNASRPAGGMHQVAVLQLQGRHLTPRLLDAETGEEVAFTTRTDADRVQALDYILWGLRGEITGTPSCINSDGDVTNSPNSAPPSITISNLGNPIDLPVLLAIEHDPSEVQLIAPRFAEGLCLPDGNGLNCHLPPGIGIAVSNPSFASPCFPACPPGITTAATDPASWVSRDPDWSATLDSSPPLLPDASQSLTLRLRMEFTGIHGNQLAVYTNLLIPLVDLCHEKLPEHP